MIKVTVDLFSGRPNPTWIINDRTGDDLLKKIAKQPEVISKQGSGYDGLGFRGITLELLGDEKEGKMPSIFTIANGTSKDQKASIQIAREIIDKMTRYEKFSMDVHNLTPVNKEIQKIIMGGIDFYEKDLDTIRRYMSLTSKSSRSSAIRVTVNDVDCTRSQYEESRFNPNFWNSNPNVRTNNNCYNYGRNWKTNTFAQPGRFSGSMAATMSCRDVKAAAMRDGLVERCNGLPTSEIPRRLMALVIAPGRDYHWYRKQKDGFWGHKPGGTNARNIDNSGVLITDPRTCDRGVGTSLHYSEFCGFFYAGKSVIIR
jgi:hypothetical protein